MDVEYTKIFFCLVDPDGRLFNVVMGDTWDPVQKREGSWTLGLLLDEDGSIYTRAEWPGGAVGIASKINPLLPQLGWLGKHPGLEGWREIAVQARTLFEAANTMTQFLQWEKSK